MIMKKDFLRFVVLVMLSVLVSCSESDNGTDNPDSIDLVIEGMTLKEKVCQMFVLRPEVLACPEDVYSLEDVYRLDVTELTDKMTDFFKEYPVGGFCLNTKNIISPAQLSRFTTDLHSLSPHPLLCVDEEGGRVARIANNDQFGLDRFESMTALARDSDEMTVYDAAHYIEIKNRVFQTLYIKSFD